MACPKAIEFNDNEAHQLAIETKAENKKIETKQPRIDNDKTNTEKQITLHMD